MSSCNSRHFRDLKLNFGLFLPLLASKAKLENLNPIKLMPGPGRPGWNEKSCQIEMNVLTLFSIGDFLSWSLLYLLKKLFLQYHHNNFEKWGPKVRWFKIILRKKLYIIFFEKFAIEIFFPSKIEKKIFWNPIFSKNFIHNSTFWQQIWI